MIQFYTFQTPSDTERYVTQLKVGPDEDTAGIINSFVGGRRIKTRKRKRKSYAK